MKLKKAISVLLTVIIISSLTIPVAAANETAFMEVQYDAALLKRGFPATYLEHTSITAKQSLYEQEDLIFDGAIITTYNEETGVFEDYEISPNGALPYGQIPTSDLSLTWTITKSSYNSSLIKVIYSYEWVHNPTFRWQDMISVSWDDTLFEMTDNDFYKVDKYDGVDMTTSGPGNSFYGRIQSEQYGYGKGFAAGVMWYADLVGQWPNVLITKLYGHGEFMLRKKVSTNPTTVIYGHYVHPTATGIFGGSIDITKYGSFSVSGISTYDERGNQKTFVS